MFVLFSNTFKAVRVRENADNYKKLNDNRKSVF